MKHVSILVPKSSVILSSVVGPYKIFNAVNQYMIETTGKPFFDIHLVGIEKDTVLYDGAFSIHCTDTLDTIKKTDLVIIAAITPNCVAQELQKNHAFIPWIREQHLKNKAEVASLCVGAFFLAETGLVDHKQCATHWAVIDVFKKMYPQIDVLPEKIVTDQEGIYSSGGAYSFLNLILHLVRKYCGQEAAIFASKFFEIEMDRDNQNQFAIFKGQKEHPDSLVKKAQTYIENNVAKKISVEELATMLAISRRNFIRRFKKATANTPLEYIQRVRVEAAKKKLESTGQNVNEVMFDVGYTDTKAFRTVFKRYTGLTPASYKNKYNREIAIVTY